jgi:hypothetical protein
VRKVGGELVEKTKRNPHVWMDGQLDWARVMTDPAQQTAYECFIANKTLVNRKIEGMVGGTKMRAKDNQREETEPQVTFLSARNPPSES